LAKIAVPKAVHHTAANGLVADLERALARTASEGARGRTTARSLAHGDGWAVEDVICTSGPDDRSFEERHSQFSIAIVAAGTFEYRSTTGHALMTPGSMLLGNDDQCFECGHEHGSGDRCIAFRFAPEYFEQIAVDSGFAGSTLRFRSPRLPAVRESAAIVAQACAALSASTGVSWEELGVKLAARVTRLLGGGLKLPHDMPASAVARVTRTVRAIERDPSADLTLRELAAEAELSAYHFLRTFERLTGATPHQYVRRMRLRDAAVRLTLEAARVIEIAYESGFNDVSAFNRAFRSEFGVSPRDYRDRAHASR
jgi:AraC family transcriptional regulator